MDIEKIPLVGREGENHWIYQLGADGLIVRETFIDTGYVGESIEIIHLTDAHINFAVPQRTKNFEAGMRFGENSDCIVATGDMLDGINADWMTYFRDMLAQYPHSMACIGNHEWAGRGEGFSQDIDERCASLQTYWPHNIYYASRVIKNRVMLIQLDNSQEKFWDMQVPMLETDIALARQKGYTVLVFYHMPLNSANPAESAIKELLPYDNEWHNYNFRDGSLRGTPHDATGKVYALITHNADIIKGAFCGHYHADIYTEIVAKTVDGKETVIPQFIGHAGCYDNGHVHRITVK